MAHHIVAFLITLAVGYWLLTLAEKQGGLNKTLGQVFAWIIIVVSLLGPVCVVANAFCRHSYGGGWHHRGGWHGMKDDCCAMGGPGGMKGDACPMMGKGDKMMGHDGMGMKMGKDKDNDKAQGDDDKDGDKKTLIQLRLNFKSPAEPVPVWAVVNPVPGTGTPKTYSSAGGPGTGAAGLFLFLLNPNHPRTANFRRILL
jgi:hypothetical protein